jgi:signal transduction histidine kinase
MRLRFWQWLEEFRKLWEAPPPDPIRHAARVLRFLRVVLQPAKLIILSVLLYQLFVADWTTTVIRSKPELLPLFKGFAIGCMVFNVVITGVVFLVRPFPLKSVRWLVFGTGLVDSLFLAGLTLITGGFESPYPLFWTFFCLIIVNALCLPLAAVQLVLNLSLSALYLAAGIGAANILLNNMAITTETGQPQALRSIDTLLLRLVVLLLLTVCCYGAQVLAARQRQVEEEAREFAARQAQLRTAGRLAAEIAHQVKNPLAIINTTMFSLRRALTTGKTDVAQQLQIIQEEIERSDRIITQLMGYARLAEGHVERLSVPEELDRALGEVFPQAVGFEVQIQRFYAPNLPTLVMQRGHLNAIFVNLLQNAREALHGQGHVRVTVSPGQESAVTITIEDDGPGIPAEQSERIFEAYFTTKEKGTGLGLAIVKHNVDLYGGTIHVESELGRGARFVIVFPAKALNHPVNHG